MVRRKSEIYIYIRISELNKVHTHKILILLLLILALTTKPSLPIPFIDFIIRDFMADTIPVTIQRGLCS